MWQQKIFGIDLYHLFYNFLIYSFFGWVWETCYVSCRKRKFVNRGFLNGPIIPIYGAGATSIFILFTNIGGKISKLENPVLELLVVYVAGMLLATILEYLTSLVMELLFHTRWWDYSTEKFNLNGRICLIVSLFWGVLSVLVTTIIQPRMTNTINGIPRQAGEIAGYVVILLFLIDFGATVVATVDLGKKIENMQKIRTELAEYLESTRLYNSSVEVKNKLADMSFAEMVTNFRDTLEERMDKVKERRFAKEVEFEPKESKEAMEQRVKEIFVKYQNYVSKKGFIHTRLTNAFPNMKIKNRDQALKDYRERKRIESLFKKK